MDLWLNTEENRRIIYLECHDHHSSNLATNKHLCDIWLPFCQGLVVDIMVQYELVDFDKYQQIQLLWKQSIQMVSMLDVDVYSMRNYLIILSNCSQLFETKSPQMWNNGDILYSINVFGYLRWMCSAIGSWTRWSSVIIIAWCKVWAATISIIIIVSKLMYNKMRKFIRKSKFFEGGQNWLTKIKRIISENRFDW